jgi:hypothetical protein
MSIDWRNLQQCSQKLTDSTIANPIQFDGLSLTADMKMIGTNLTKLRIKPAPAASMKKLVLFMALPYWSKLKYRKKKAWIYR